MRKLNDMNIKIVEYLPVLAAIGQQVRAIQVCSQPASSHMTAPLSGVIATGLFDRNIGESLVETAAGIPQPVPGDSESNTDWATVVSTPLNRRNRFAVLSMKTTWTVLSSLLFSHDKLPSVSDNSHHLRHIRHHSSSNINSNSVNRRISQRYWQGCYWAQQCTVSGKNYKKESFVLCR